MRKRQAMTTGLGVLRKNTGRSCAARQLALELIERMLSESMQRNTITYKAAIYACEKGVVAVVAYCLAGAIS
jgi:hypothetical protein